MVSLFETIQIYFNKLFFLLNIKTLDIQEASKSGPNVTVVWDFHDVPTIQIVWFCFSETLC